jgi:hypothetical protein
LLRLDHSTAPNGGSCERFLQRATSYFIAVAALVALIAYVTNKWRNNNAAERIAYRAPSPR